MLTPIPCVQCQHDISGEFLDTHTLNIDPNVFTNNQIHATCFGKAAASGLFAPAVAAGLRSCTPSDLVNPNTISGQLFQLGKDLEQYGAGPTPLAPEAPLRKWLVNFNIDIFTGNRQVADKIHQLLKNHIDQFPKDQEIYKALVDREVLDNISVEDAIQPPEGIEVSCFTILPGNNSASDLAAQEAAAIKQAQRKLRDLD
ncbi:MAG: hypothetical protein QE278_14685 [Limnobacter sp.]|nr:hypothetical protein [Limnobacter sp.]